MINATMCLDKYIGDGLLLLHDHDPDVCQEGETFTFTDGTLQNLQVYCDDMFDLQKWRGCVQDLNCGVTNENGILRNYHYVQWPAWQKFTKKQLKTSAYVFNNFF